MKAYIAFCLILLIYSNLAKLYLAAGDKVILVKFVIDTVLNWVF